MCTKNRLGSYGLIVANRFTKCKRVRRQSPHTVRPHTLGQDGLHPFWPSSKSHPGQSFIVNHPTKGGFINRNWIARRIV